jgi:hypothetical protein
MKTKRLFLFCAFLISLFCGRSSTASEWKETDIEANRHFSIRSNQELLKFVESSTKAKRYAIVGIGLLSGAYILSQYYQMDPLSPKTLHDQKAFLALINKQRSLFATKLFQGMMAGTGSLFCLKSFFAFPKSDTAKRPNATFNPTALHQESNTLPLKTGYLRTKALFPLLRFARNFRIALPSFFLPLLSSEYREVEEPRYQYAPALNINFKNIPINMEDLARFSLYSNLHTLDLQNSGLTDDHIEIAALLGVYVKKLDIRGNPEITPEGLKSAIGYTLCRQVGRRVFGFRQLEELIFDAPCRLILDEAILISLQLPKNRKLQIYGALQNKGLLKEISEYNFFYKNTSAFNLHKFLRDNSTQGSPAALSYHNNNKILFTPTGLSLPSKFSNKKYESLRHYFCSSRYLYQDAHDLESGKEEDITSFMQIDTQNEFTFLASDFRYAYTHTPINILEKQGLLVEIRKIEALSRHDFLKSLKIVVTDRSWF